MLPHLCCRKSRKGPESSKSLALPSQERSGNLQCKELAWSRCCRKESWSISNHCLVLSDDCEPDKSPGLCAAIQTTLLVTSSVSVAADSLKWTSSNRILLSPSRAGKTAAQLLHTFCRGNQHRLAAAACPAVVRDHFPTPTSHPRGCVWGYLRDSLGLSSPSTLCFLRAHCSDRMGGVFGSERNITHGDITIPRMSVAAACTWGNATWNSLHITVL